MEAVFKCLPGWKHFLATSYHWRSFLETPEARNAKLVAFGCWHADERLCYQSISKTEVVA